MKEYENNKLIVNGEITRTFQFAIRDLIEVDEECIVLLEIPFDSLEKNNIIRLDCRGTVVWTIANSRYSKLTYPFERMILRDGWLYATDFYARRCKIDIRSGKIVDVSIFK